MNSHASSQSYATLIGCVVSLILIVPAILLVRLWTSNALMVYGLGFAQTALVSYVAARRSYTKSRAAVTATIR